MSNTFFKNNILRVSVIVLLTTVGLLFSNVSQAQSSEAEEPFNAGDMIMHHILDSHVWHFWDGHYGTVFLPIIVYSEERGLNVFSS